MDAQHWTIINDDATILSHNNIMPDVQHWAILSPIDALCRALSHIDVWCTALSKLETSRARASLMLVAEQAGLANNAHAQDVQKGVGVRGDLCHSLRTKAFCANPNNLRVLLCIQKEALWWPWNGLKARITLLWFLSFFSLCVNARNRVKRLVVSV